MLKLKLAVIWIISAILISPGSAVMYDIICNVDGADCYIDDVYIGSVFANHLYYSGTLSSDTKYHVLTVKSENDSVSQSLPDSWDDFNSQKVVVYLESGIYPPMGTINIFTQPSWATIYFQEDYLGKGEYKEIGTTKEDAPYSLTTFQGPHRIKIWLDGYEVISDKIFVYGSDEFDTCYYLEYVGDHTSSPYLGPDPTPTPVPPPTPEIVIQEKEVIKEVKVIETVNVEVFPSIWVILFGLIFGGIGGVILYKNRAKIPKISLPKIPKAKGKGKKKSNKDFWDD
jgi:hypothetical protein